jgi:hypothetical protein
MTLDLKALRALCDQATPGPWTPTKGYLEAQAGQYADDVSVLEDPTGDAVIEHVYYDGHHTIVRPQDVEFIASARTALPVALDEIERLRAALSDAACCLEANSDKSARRMWAARIRETTLRNTGTEETKE